jgi:hypothetical protein
MKRIALFALPLAIALTAMVWPIARHGDAGVCALMTPARMLENPALASEFARALRSGDADEVARVRGKLQEIRAVHGCEGEIALPTRAPEIAPALPPGHPPVGDRAEPAWPMFDEPRTLSI